MKKYGIIMLSVLAISGLVGLYLYKKQNPEPIIHLPYFGKKQAAQGDTIYHTVVDFSFLNQEGKTIIKETVKDKIYVADYFFTTCGSICPKMKKQMNRVYKKFLNDPEIVLLSHTVDPETDTVQTLMEFSKQFNSRPDKWYFLTGDKKQLYTVARDGYLIDASQGDGGPDDFIHTQNFALVDKAFHIRGYYDGTDSASVDKLMRDILILKEEYQVKK